MKPCPLCGTRAVPRADGSCPSCNGLGAPKEVPDTAKKNADNVMNSPWAMIGILIAVTAVGFWTNRTPSGGVDEMTLVVTASSLLGGIFGLVTMRAIAARQKR